MVPLCPRLFLGGAINPSVGKKSLGSPGLFLGPWLAVAPWADFRGAVPCLEVTSPLLCMVPACTDTGEDMPRLLMVRDGVGSRRERT